MEETNSVLTRCTAHWPVHQISILRSPKLTSFSLGRKNLFLPTNENGKKWTRPLLQCTLRKYCLHYFESYAYLMILYILYYRTCIQICLLKKEGGWTEETDSDGNPYMFKVWKMNIFIGWSLPPAVSANRTPLTNMFFITSMSIMCRPLWSAWWLAATSSRPAQAKKCSRSNRWYKSL